MIDQKVLIKIKFVYLFKIIIIKILLRMTKLDFKKLCSCIILHSTKMLFSHPFFTAIGCSPTFLTVLTIISVTHFVVDLLRCLAQ